MSWFQVIVKMIKEHEFINNEFCGDITMRFFKGTLTVVEKKETFKTQE